MSGVRSRIIFGLATLVVMVLIGLGLLLGQLFKNFYVSTFEERLEKESQFIANVISKESTFNDSLTLHIKEISQELDLEITIFTSKGELTLNTLRYEGTTNQLQKKIREERDQAVGFEMIGDDSGLFHYVSKLTEGELKGYLILTLSVDSFQNINQKIWVLLFTSFAIAFLIIVILGTRITNQYTRPIAAATRVATELAKGNYRARTYEDKQFETGMLTQSINVLARNLQEMTAQQEMQQDRLRTLIESMGSGLILIDGKGYIHLVNKFFLEFFDADSDDYIHKLYYHAFVHPEIVEVVEEIFLTEMQVRRQLHLPLRLERRYFETYGAPIIGLNEEWKGVVLVFHDITELKKLEQMRKDFVANVSHELKTPITSIKGFSETLLDGAMENEELRERFLQIILKESDRLESLINDLLDLSKMEQGGFSLSIRKMDLRDLLQDVILMLSNKAEQKGLTLSSKLGNESVTIDGDSHRIKQIFINLINNAIMYTLTGGKIEVSIHCYLEKVEILVSDTGVGINKEEIPRIFERFYRVDRARSRNSGGTGLGLAIVKHIVELHNGQINVSSEKGEGTTFKVTFRRNFTKD